MQSLKVNALIFGIAFIDVYELVSLEVAARRNSI